MTALPADTPPGSDLVLVANFAPGAYSWSIDDQGRLAVYLAMAASPLTRDGAPHPLPTMAEIQARNDEFWKIGAR